MAVDNAGGSGVNLHDQPAENVRTERVGYMLQILLPHDEWVDAKWVDALNHAIEDYSILCPMRGMNQHMRVIRRTVIDEVLT